MDSATEEGKKLGLEGKKKNLVDAALLKKHVVLSDETNETPGATPQSDAQDMMDKRSEARQKGDKLKGDVVVDALLKGGDQCVNNPTATLTITVDAASTHETIEDCTESIRTIDYKTLYFFRNLQLDIFHQDKIVKKYCQRRIKRCTSRWIGHSDDDPNCDTYRWIDGENREIPLYQNCDSLGWRYYDTDERTFQYERTDLKGEKWVMEDPQGVFAKVRDNTYNLGKTECVSGAETRSFYGKGFHQPCWRQRVEVLCPIETPQVNECEALRKKGCLEVSEQCTQKAADGSCVKWKKRYRCPVRQSETIHTGTGRIHNIDGGSLVGPSENFNDMAASLTQLQTLSDMQQEVRNITSVNQSVSVFKGQCNRCKKNICENVLYDCCAVKGLAMDLNLVIAIRKNGNWQPCARKESAIMCGMYTKPVHGDVDQF